MKLLNGRKGERILVSTAEEGCKYADGQLFALLWAGVISRSKGECSACGKEAACARQPGRSVNYCQSCWGAEMNRRRDLSKTGKIFLKTYPWPKQKERARIELRLRPGVTLEELLVMKSQRDRLKNDLKFLTGRELTIRPTSSRSRRSLS